MIYVALVKGFTPFKRNSLDHPVCFNIWHSGLLTDQIFKEAGGEARPHPAEGASGGHPAEA